MVAVITAPGEMTVGAGDDGTTGRASGESKWDRKGRGTMEEEEVEVGGCCWWACRGIRTAYGRRAGR